MTLKLKEIYEYYIKLKTAFSQQDTHNFPIKFLYIVHKNLKALKIVADNIDSCRMQLLEKYGEPIEEDGKNMLFLSPENQEKAERELNDFLETMEFVNISIFNINLLPESMQLTSSQMEAIMFMLTEE